MSAFGKRDGKGAVNARLLEERFSTGVVLEGINSKMIRPFVDDNHMPTDYVRFSIVCPESVNGLGSIIIKGSLDPEKNKTISDSQIRLRADDTGFSPYVDVCLGDKNAKTSVNIMTEIGKVRGGAKYDDISMSNEDIREMYEDTVMDFRKRQRQLDKERGVSRKVESKEVDSNHVVLNGINFKTVHYRGWNQADVTIPCAEAPTGYGVITVERSNILPYKLTNGNKSDKYVNIDLGDRNDRMKVSIGLDSKGSPKYIEKDNMRIQQEYADVRKERAKAKAKSTELQVADNSFDREKALYEFDNVVTLDSVFKRGATPTLSV